MQGACKGFVQGLYFYPIKSCAGVTAQFLDLHTDLGVYGDRVVALVHPETKRVLTQREYPQLARVTIDPSYIASEKILLLSTVRENAPPLLVKMPFAAFHDKRTECFVHKDLTSGFDIGSSVFFESILGFKPTVVLLDEKQPRRHSSPFLGEEITLGYADSHPVLLTTTASIAAVNRVLREKGQPIIPMNRFRPNIIVESVDAWEEDAWRMIRIGNVVLEYAKPCSRCLMTTIDQQTGVRLSNEPLATLARLRPALGGPLFGNYYVVRQAGAIHLQSTVEVIETRAH